MPKKYNHFVFLWLICLGSCDSDGLVSKKQSDSVQASSTPAFINQTETSFGAARCQQLALGLDDTTAPLAKASSHDTNIATMPQELKAYAQKLSAKVLDTFANKIPSWISFEVVSPQDISPDHHRWEGIWTFNRIPLCDLPLSVHEIKHQPTATSNTSANNTKIQLNGYTPSMQLQEPTPAFNRLNIEQLSSSLATYLKSNSQQNQDINPLIQIGVTEPCWWVNSNNNLSASQEFDLTIDHNPYEAVVDAQGTVKKLEAKSFEISGTASIQEKEPSDHSKADLTTVTLTDFAGTGYLCSPQFSTTSANTTMRAFSNQFNFIFPNSDVRYYETNVFVHAQEHANWLATLGDPGYFQGPQIVLNLVYDATDTIGPQYSGATSQSLAGIRVPPGNGITLQNLQTDSDAISHEVGHHVVYKFLRDTSGESLIIHEALADYFVFAHTEDSCLGESICPLGSATCIKSGCLRDANNTYSMNDAIWQAFTPHRKGQLLSGILWNLGKKIGQKNVGALTYKAVTFFPSSMKYENLLSALVTADGLLNNGANSCAILKEATIRGMGSRISASMAAMCPEGLSSP